MRHTSVVRSSPWQHAVVFFAALLCFAPALVHAGPCESGEKHVEHEVESGETLGEIALEHGVTIGSITRANPV